MGAGRIIILMIRKITPFILVLSALTLNGCTALGVATGAAAVTGISAAQEGGLGRAFSDAEIKLKINDAWLNYSVKAFAQLSTTINQGRVLITGVVQNPEHRVEAVRLAWQVEGVDQVINEIQVADSAGVTGFVKDSWITSRLRGALTLDRGVQSINYSIDTVRGIVYLMGVAQSQTELNRVIETARTISGVKQVVSYVKLAGEPFSKTRDAGEPVRPQTSVLESSSPQQLTPQNNYGVGATTTNIKPRAVEQEITEDIDVPARTVPEDAPRIEDQY